MLHCTYDVNVPLRIHRKAEQLHFIHEKEIHFTISLL
jgi:hypothetical protein